MTNQNSDANTKSAVTVGKHLGRVKWFNSKLGYGFITTNLNSDDHDIFIHQSNIHPTQSRYRTLREGEYVSLNVSESGETRQAIDVTGVNGGPLNCDLERNMRNTRQQGSQKTSNESNDEDFTEVQSRGSRTRPRASP